MAYNTKLKKTHKYLKTIIIKNIKRQKVQKGNNVNHSKESFKCAFLTIANLLEFYRDKETRIM